MGIQDMSNGGIHNQTCVSREMCQPKSRMTPRPAKVIISARLRVGWSMPASRKGKRDSTHVVRMPLLLEILVSSCAKRALVVPVESEACAGLFKNASAQISVVA